MDQNLHGSFSNFITGKTCPYVQIKEELITKLECFEVTKLIQIVFIALA